MLNHRAYEVLRRLLTHVSRNKSIANGIRYLNEFVQELIGEIGLTVCLLNGLMQGLLRAVRLSLLRCCIQ